MVLLRRSRIRMAADQATQTSESMLDILTNATPELWLGNDVQFEVALFDGGTLINDLSNITSLVLEVKELANRNSAPLMTKTLAGASLNTITIENWNDGTQQQALFTFSAAETNIDLSGAADQERDYWLIVAMITNDNPGRLITIQQSVLKIVEDGTGTAAPPPETQELFYNQVEADQRFQQQAPDQGSVRFKNGKDIYIFNIDDGLFYPLVVNTIGGSPVLGLGTGESL